MEELESAGEGAKAVATPGMMCSHSMIDDDVLLAIDRYTRVRGVAARANYLSADRPDCQFAAKEICRWMVVPTEVAMAALKRQCRYLVGKPRLVFWYVLQEMDSIEC